MTVSALYVFASWVLMFINSSADLIFIVPVEAFMLYAVYVGTLKCSDYLEYKYNKLNREGKEDFKAQFIAIQIVVYTMLLIVLVLSCCLMTVFVV